MVPAHFILSFSIEKSGRVVRIGWRKEKLVTGVSTEVPLNSSNATSSKLLSRDLDWFSVS